MLVRSPENTDGNGTLETVFVRETSGEEIGRNKQPFFVEPGKFGYRLVRGELEFPEPGTVEAWLSRHPEITVISRDRGGRYGRAAARAHRRRAGRDPRVEGGVWIS